MVFNPYQSSLLRFVARQYRWGVDRHRSAFGQARAKAKLSAEVGTALMMLPVYIAARASVLAGQKLRQAISRRQLAALSPRVKKLLNFSGFDSINSSDFESDFESGQSLSIDLQFNRLSCDVAQASARPIFQTLVAVGSCLSSAQITVLSEPRPLAPNGSGPSRFMRWVGKWSTAARSLLSFHQKKSSVEANVGVFEQKTLSLPAQITGVASDLETRSLILVLDYSAVWNGLSADQQSKLQHQIAAFLHPEFTNSPPEANLLNVSSIPRLITNWIGIAKQLIESLYLSADYSSVDYPLVELSVANESSLILDSKADLGCLAIQKNEAISPADIGNSEPVPKLAKPTLSTLPTKLLCNEKNNRKQARKTIEANVVSVTYVEHPLEKMLKWVDRILLWAEKHWELIAQRIRFGMHG